MSSLPGMLKGVASRGEENGGDTCGARFLDVFPEDFPRLPLDMEIEFCIDLISGVAPISKAPYRMALAELKELKTQIQ